MHQSCKFNMKNHEKHTLWRASIKILALAQKAKPPDPKKVTGPWDIFAPPPQNTLVSVLLKHIDFVLN